MTMKMILFETTSGVTYFLYKNTDDGRIYLNIMRNEVYPWDQKDSVIILDSWAEVRKNFLISSDIIILDTTQT